MTVNRVAVGPDFQDTITYSGWTTKAMSANGTTTPAWYTTGCWFSIALTGNSAGAYNSTAPAPVSPIKPINTIPISNVTTTQGVTNPAAATAPIAILSPVGVKKTFNSFVLGAAGGRTRLTVELSNKSAVAQTAAALTDTLPTGGGWTMVVATPPNASTTCASGTVAAVAGSGTVSISGATIPAGTVAIPGTCTFSADIQVTGPSSSQIDNVIPPGALTTSVPGLTNVLEARATLFTRDRNIALNKVFGNGGAAQGGTPVPMTITLTGDLWPFNEVGFSDNLISVQPGLVVAPNPNASTTCRQVDLVTPPFPRSSVVAISYQSATLATVSAVPGATSISLANAYLVGSENESLMPGNFNSCTLTVDVVASTTGNKTNTIPASNIVTRESATNTAPTSATLTVQPNTQLNKAFTPSTISAGSPFTLTLTIFNVNTSPQTGFFITDTLPAGVIADSIASNTCGGTAVITSGGTVVDLPAAGTSVAANASCVQLQ